MEQYTYNREYLQKCKLNPLLSAYHKARTPVLLYWGKNTLIFMKCKENHSRGKKSSLCVYLMLKSLVRKLTRNVTTVLNEAICKPQVNNMVLV
jgi:hypothetical protein